MKNKEEVELILTRLILFLQGKWCVVVTAQAGDEERGTADGEMKSWFAAAEQVGGVCWVGLAWPGLELLRLLRLSTLL